MATARGLAAGLAMAAWQGAESWTEPICPGNIDFKGVGDVTLIPTGWPDVTTGVYPFVEEGKIVSMMGSRAYFGKTCAAGIYNNSYYLALDLRGKTLRYTTDFSKAGCGCNAAFYLTNMFQNKRKSDCGDYYCDANNVCGESCAEIDIQEGNRFSWHSTLHAAKDPSGFGKGYGGGGVGWSGPRDWSIADYGPNGRCVDTDYPFQVSVTFPLDDQGHLRSMDVRLTQGGHSCPLFLSLNTYRQMAEMDRALAMGMTPIVSYWSSKDMLWMDGKGADRGGPCEQDFPQDCGTSVQFYGFSVTPHFPNILEQTTAITTFMPTTTTTTTTVAVAPPAVQWPYVFAFFGGVLATLGVQGLCLLGYHAFQSSKKQKAEAASPAAQSPLNKTKATTGASSQNLLAAEGGGA